MMADQVEVWHARLDLPDAALRRLYTVLSPEEQLRAGQFKFYADSSGFIARRGILRWLLAKHTGIAPNAIELRRSHLGKLQLAPHQDSRMRFNLSHSGPTAIYAITLDRSVGIDIERVKRDVALREVANLTFSQRERDVISRLPAVRRRAAFFEIWTRKESLLKALGIGFTLDPASINVAHDGVLNKENVAQHNGCLWKLVSLSAAGFAAALAAEGEGWSARQHYWPRDWAKA